MIARLRHMWLALRLAPRLLADPALRQRLQEMRRFTRDLPAALKAPLLDALRRATPDRVSVPESERDLRDLADLAALLDRASPLGLCLRRSLTRYHFLRRSGIPVTLHFGARFVNGQADREVTGHAWLVLNGVPYHEDSDNWRGYSVMLSYPQEDRVTAA